MINTFEYIKNSRTTSTIVWDDKNEQSCKEVLHLLFDNAVPLEILRKLNFGNLNVDKEFDEYFKQPD